jgi:predicted lipoprotein with Yx(FWY)xxD motif
MSTTITKKTLGTLVGAVALTALLGAAAAYGAGEAVQTAKKEGTGTFLADSKGMTLYYFKNDTPGKSACAGPCAEKWPPFYVEKVTVGYGLSAGDFGAITREDGKKQTTYKGKPLYYFSGDTKAGDTNGQGVRDVWYVVNP